MTPPTKSVHGVEVLRLHTVSQYTCVARVGRHSIRLVGCYYQKLPACNTMRKSPVLEIPLSWYYKCQTADMPDVKAPRYRRKKQGRREKCFVRRMIEEVVEDRPRPILDRA